MLSRRVWCVVLATGIGLGDGVGLVGCSSSTPASDAPVGADNKTPDASTPATAPIATGAGDAWSFAVARRDPRKSTAQPRSVAVVKTEVAGLKTLVEKTSPAAPDRPALLRRLAEGYVELSRAHARAGETTLAEAARLGAIGAYTMLEMGHKDLATLDEVLYFHALELELMGDTRQARSIHYDLIKRYPTSRYVAGAYFAFGEMFLRESKVDEAKVQLARQSYAEVVKLGALLLDEARGRLAELEKRPQP